MENTMIPQGIEIVQKAIAADQENDYERALALYRDALARFTLGLKYEKNEARKKLILDRVEGYMKRAEELSDYLKKQSELDKDGGGGGTGVASKSHGDGNNEPDGMDADKKKLRGALAAAIVSEKPNVKWEDVAGLENAKESLKEVIVLRRVTPSYSRLGVVLASCFLTLYPLKLISYRLSFYQQSFLSFSLASESRSRAFSSTGHPGRENHI
jgi:SpoVK/Ycf46/Vps4 family AAA+-type ATPase